MRPEVFLAFIGVGLNCVAARSPRRGTCFTFQMSWRVRIKEERKLAKNSSIRGNDKVSHRRKSIREKIYCEKDKQINK